MEVIESYRKYIQERQSGKRVVSRAECDGMCAIKQLCENGTFSILSIEEHRSALVCYEQRNHRIKITSFIELTDHHLGKVMSQQILDHGNSRNWEPLFYRDSDGKVLYDSYFDHYTITKEDNITCENILKGVKEELMAMLPSNHKTLFLKGIHNWNCLPLVYVLQTLMEDVLLLPTYKDEDIASSCKNFFYSPNNIKINIGGNIPITFGAILTHKQQLHIPMDDITLKSNVVVTDGEEDTSIMNWGQLIDGESPSYSVGDISVLILQVPDIETDGYQNLFWVKEYEQGKHAELLIYSKFTS